MAWIAIFSIEKEHILLRTQAHVMKQRDDSKPLPDFLQVDDAYLGGKRRGGNRGRVSQTRYRFSLPWPPMKMAIQFR